MKKLISLFVFFVCLPCASASLAFTDSSEIKAQEMIPAYPTLPKLSAAKAQQVKRGEYLVKLGDCIACHTKSGGKVFAGGLAIKTPFGDIFTPNITSDKETGIGGWTDQAFIIAMRQGKNPKGHYYYPAFPYLYFNRLSDQDLIDIKAYLDHTPAVHQANQDNKMMFPFNIRFLQLGWRILFFRDEGVFKNDPSKSALWNRGKYIVDGLGHCSMCHTPMHTFISKKWVLAAPIKKYYLTGTMIDGFYAPNITSTTLKTTSLSEFAEVFKDDQLIGGGHVEGPMAEANHDSLKYLTDRDVKAIYTYLKTVKSEEPPKEHAKGVSIEAGKKIYDQYCMGCHTTGAGGAPVIGRSADWAPRIKLGMTTLYKNAIHGIRGMPAKGTCMTCTDNEIQSAVQYIVSVSKPGSASAVSAPKPIKKLTIADGKKLYLAHCASCHNGGDKNAPINGDKQAWDHRIKKGADVLIYNTIRGYKTMPMRGGCQHCNDAQIKAAVKYMLQTSKTRGDYALW